jgi:pimeloyl-ACP methyl ester carboxylesterase
MYYARLITLLALVMLACSPWSDTASDRDTAKPFKGYFKCGIPYTRIGNGPHVVVVFPGLLLLDNKPQPLFAVGMYTFLGKAYTVYVAGYQSGLPRGCSLNTIADDYATMIQTEFEGAVDIIGVSTGGSIAQCFAADHPDLVRRLIIQSSAFTLSSETKALQLHIAHLAREKRWVKANVAFLQYLAPRKGILKVVSGPAIRLGAFLMSLGAPLDPADIVTLIEAEDRFEFSKRLSEIVAPTLIAAGDSDPFYPEELFRQTAAGIPHSKLILYKGMGHPAMGKRFERDVLAFLKERP